MKSIIVYNSQTGFTEKYAKWLSEALECDSIPLKQAKNLNIQDYDVVIYGGWCMAGNINKINWILEKIPSLYQAQKKLAIFAVGGSPIENPEVQTSLKNISSKIQEKLPSEADFEKAYKLVYCPGGFNYDKMNIGSKLMMKMFISMLKSKENKTKTDEEMIKMISGNYDISDKKYLEPLLDFLK